MDVVTTNHLESRIEGRGAELLRAAHELVEPIRAAARQAELDRAVSQEIVDRAERAGLIAAMVPKSYGGDGLGFDVLCETARILARGDASAAWTIAFLIEHNWMACHLHLDAQKELFADRNAVTIAGALAPTGTGEKVDGGYLVKGRWRYNSASANSDWIIIGALQNDWGNLVHRLSIAVDTGRARAGSAGAGAGRAGAVRLPHPQGRSRRPRRLVHVGDVGDQQRHGLV